MLRWAVTEAIVHEPAGTRPRGVKDAIKARRGASARGIAKTAAARTLLTQVFYAMRDGHVRRVLDFWFIRNYVVTGGERLEKRPRTGKGRHVSGDPLTCELIRDHINERKRVTFVDVEVPRDA